jgi:DNA-binding CsgD family transcriptional regulator
VLRERETASQVVGQVLAQAQQGVGRALFVLGDAGMGKTALLDLARATAADTMSVPQAKGSVMEDELAFAFAEQFLGPLVSTEPTGEVPGVDPLSQQRSIYERALAQVRRWADTGPVLMVLDDLQWADPDSMDLVGFLARRLAGLPAAIIAASRSWPPDGSALAHSLAHAGFAELVRLGPLSEEASGDLLGELTGRTIDEELRRRARALAGGNPLLLSAAARTITEIGDLPPRGSSDPGHLRQTLLLSHLGGLPPAALDCARAASVLGGRVHLAAVQAVAEQRPESFTQAFDALVGANVLRDAGRGWAEFTHELLASALYDDMAPARRHQLHTRAFFHYLGRSDVASASAHALAADMVGDERAIATVTDAGVQALRSGAVETGLAQIQAAVTLAGPEPAEALLVTEADALFAAGRAEEAVPVYWRLLARPLGPAVRTEILAKMARAEAYAGRLPEALGTYDRLVNDPTTTGPQGLALLLERAHVILEIDGPAAALAAVEAVPSEVAASEALEVVAGYLRLQTGDPVGLPALDRAARAARERFATDPREALASFNPIAVQVGACGITERVEEALELVELGTQWLRAAGASRSVIPLRLARVGILVDQGLLGEALADADDLEEEFDLDALFGPHLNAFRLRALVRLGRLQEAWTLWGETGELPGARAYFVTLCLAIARGDLLLAEDRFGEAVEAFREVEKLVARFGAGEPCSPRWAAGAIDAALRAGRAEDAERIVAWLLKRATGLPCRWPRMIALAGQAGLAAAGGDDQRADTLYGQSLQHRPVGLLDRAQILLRYGAWLRRGHQTVRSRSLLAEALQLSEDQGAVLLADQARSELAAAGGRRPRRRRDLTLSPQEARVARIAAGGATTREIALELHLSPRTVESHLAHVYLKLGVSSRGELRRRRTELHLDQA